MATDAHIGYGTLFGLSADQGVSYTTVAEVIDITPPAFSRDVVDATHMESPDWTREFIPGLRDPGETSFEMNFVPGSDADMLFTSMSAVQSNDTQYCRITYPNGATWSFKANLSGYEPAVPIDDRMTATVTMKVTSSVTVVPA